MTHKLESPWCIWEHRDESKLSYGDNLHKLCTFHTAEEFWSYWNNIPNPSEILYDGFTKKRFKDRSIGALSVFKDGIAPEWEDPQNAVGGEWFIRKRMNPQTLDDMWEKIVLILIGETSDPDGEITGARIIHRNRKQDRSWFRYEIWLRSRDRVKADQIRDSMLRILSETDAMNLNTGDFVYKEHSAT